MLSRFYNITWDNYPWVDSTKSPCIDSGNAIFHDPDGTIIDIGAYSFFQQLDVPEALPPDSMSLYRFLAIWTSAYGALGYTLDVALDSGFSNYVYDSLEIEEDTCYMVEGLDEGTQYFYRVNSYNTALISDYSNTQSAITLGVSVVENQILDDLSTFPNPCSNTTRLRYQINDKGITICDLYTISGVNIKRLIDEIQMPGEYELEIDLSGLPAGIYYFRLKAGDQVGGGKMVKMD